MRHVMLDLETMGTAPGSTILSIGAAEFCPINGVGETFYVVVNRANCNMHGLTESVTARRWWDEQSEDAKAVLNQADSVDQSLTLSEALLRFTGYIESFGTNVAVWGNGADFDNTLIAAAYSAIGVPLPWKWWNNRCYRTLKNIHITATPGRTGVHHNAADDARFQAEHMVAMCKLHNLKLG